MQSEYKNPADDPLLPARDVKKALGLESDMSLWRWLKKGILPEPVRINGRRYWRRSVISTVQRTGAQ